MALLGLSIAGCSNTSATQVKAGAISITNASGKAESISTLALASTMNLSMMPVGDIMNAGVDWTVTCAGNPVTGSVTNGACGTLAPAHTTDGGTTLYTAPSVIPINGSITVTATVTSNPSQSKSVSITIVAAPIGVSLAPTVSSIEIDTTLTLNAHVSNDPLDAGVVWTAACGSNVCGSFNPNVSPGSGTVFTTYTAPTAVPTGGTVTIAATSLTDTTKSASATLTITAPPPPIPVTVSVYPTKVYADTAGSGHTVLLVAVVTNDTAAAGVDWSVACGASNCGSITPKHTASGASASYSAPSTVPPGGNVTVTAASTTNPTVSASATAEVVTTAPIVVTISTAPPATMTASSQATMAANVAGDTGNLGVNWTANCGSTGACGSFNLSPAHTASGGQIIYTAPAAVPSGGLITITASSPASTPSDAAIALTTILAQPPSLSFTQAPPQAMVAATQVPVGVTVKNDVAPGGVNWAVQCSSTVPGGCGWISPLRTASGVAATYTAPPVTADGTSVTVKATSVADSSVSINSSPIAINPSTTLSVSFIPSLPAQIASNATVNLTAAVANDAADAGADWQVCSSGCGFFTVKPAIPAIPATATTPYVPAVPAVTATTVSGWANGLAIPYTAPQQSPSSGMVAIAALAHADATKAISGTIAISAVLTGPALSGTVLAGSQPVAGASVSLYSAGTTGYASASAQIASAITDKSGSFTVPAGYTCPSSASQMYLVAIGGKAGTNSANPNLSLMTALGSCNGLGSSPVIVNEVTTVASAWATAPFGANDALSGNNTYLYLGASSGNLTGLANAFAAVNNLVDISTGQARFVTPAGNAAVPYVEINTLADALNACTATSGGVEGDGSACGVLFAATDLLGTGSYSGSIAPSDTLQAAYNIAQHLITNYGYSLDPSGSLLGLATANSPFQPILAALPNDWSISLNYTGGGGLTKTSTVGSFAVDAVGNLWITDTAAGTVIEWNSIGAALSPSTGFPAGGGPIAIDAAGNAWVSGNGVLYELTPLGDPAPGTPFGGVAGGGNDMAFDSQGNLWIANGNGVNEFNDLGAALSPAEGFTNSGIAGIASVCVDSSNNVWVGNGAFSNFAELTNPGGQLIVQSTNQGVGTAVPELSADGNGNIWGFDNGSYLFEVPPYGGKGSELIPAFYSPGGDNGETPNGLNFFAAAGMALDGSSVLWVASQGGGTGPVIPPSVLPIAPSMIANDKPHPLASASLAAGPLRVAVDGSGNVWVLLANNTVTEYVGVATPVVTPIALGVVNHKLGAKP